MLFTSIESPLWSHIWIFHYAIYRFNRSLDAEIYLGFVYLVSCVLDCSSFFLVEKKEEKGEVK